MLVGGGGGGAGHQVASRTDDGRTVIAYTPLGRPLTLRMDAIVADAVRGWWFDPRSGEATDLGRFPAAGEFTFDPPGEERRGNDWVLVLDSAAAGLGPPGR